MDPVTRLVIDVLGSRGYLLARVKVPEHLVADLPDLLAGAQVHNPAVDPDAVARTIWRLGSAALRRNNQRHVPVRTADLPHARPAADAHAQACRPSPPEPPNGLRRSRY